MPTDCEPVRLVEEASETDDRIETQQLERDSRIVEIESFRAQRALNVFRQRIRIDLEPDLQCSLRAHARTYAAVGCAGDGFVQPQRRHPRIPHRRTSRSERLGGPRGSL